MRTLIASLVSAILLLAGNVNAQIGLDNENRQQVVMSSLSAMPLAFTENSGQWDEKALFRAEAGAAVFFFCADEVVYVFTRDTDELDESSSLRRQPYGPYGESLPDASPFDRPRYKKEAMVIKAQFVGANPDAEIVAEDRLPHNCNYFYGDDPDKWRTDVPNYSAITYKDIWPGIDLRYHGNGQGMKYDFIVNPGADILRIRVRYDGVNNLAITSNGDLQADTRFGLIYENIPSVYQEAAGSKQDISGRYRIIEPGVFGFEVEGYNPSFALIIDPQLVYSTYLGGSSDDQGFGIAVGGSGSAYVTGHTWSSDFPTVNPYDDSHNGSYDVFVSKLYAGGNSLEFSTYLGGSRADEGLAITVDGSGSAYITGYTNSPDFPIQDPYQTDQDTMDVFVAKLSASGNSLGYSTYLGGNNIEYGYGIAVDGSGNAYVTGHTHSTDFPTQYPYQTNQDTTDAFVTKISPSGNSLVYSTYLGGDNIDYGVGIDVDGNGNAYVTGATASTDFPTQDPYQTDQPGFDVFVTKLSSIGNSLVYSTYIGGDITDIGNAISVDGSGNAYIAGETSSPNFPTQNPYQGDPDQANYTDAFVTKLSPLGDSLVYSTYLGGDGLEDGRGIAIDGGGNAYITGITYSTDFPTTQNAYQTYQGPMGFEDVFMTELSPLGDSLVYSTYLGGIERDRGYAIAMDGSGNAWFTGYTASYNFPTEHPYDGSWNGDFDVFVAKFGPEGPPPCNYVIGDFNGSGVFNIADIVDAFSRLKTGLPEPAYLCECPPGSGNEWAVAMDVNNSCAFNVADIIDGFSKLKTGLPELVPCDQCPPGGRLTPGGDHPLPIPALESRLKVAD